MGREFGVGGLLSETLSLISSAARETLLYVLLIGGLTAVGVWFGLTETASMTLGFGFRIDPSEGPLASLFELVSIVASIVAGYLLLTRFLATRNRRPDPENRFWPYVGMAILSIVAMVVGLILLIVPGIVLMVRWAAASGFVIGAQEGVIDSLTASWRATRGHGWTIFLAGLVVIVGLLVLGGVLGVAAEPVGAIPAAIVSALFEAFASAVFLGFGIAVYCLVHDDTRELDAVFA